MGEDSPVDVGAVAIAAVVAAVIMVPELVFLFRRGRRRSPVGVLRGLQAPGATHRVSVRFFDLTGGLWDPSAPFTGVGGLFPGRGRGEYRLDPDREVALTWFPRDGTPPREYTGPVPDRLRTLAAAPRRSGVLRLVPAVYVVFIAGGASVGFALAGPGSGGGAAGGGVLGFVAAYPALLLFARSMKRRSRRRATKAAAPRG